MAGHIQDRWYKTEPNANGKPVRTKTDRHGTGLRYRARYVSPDGTEKSKSFPDGKKRLAEEWLSRIEADMSRGQYIDPRAARMTFQEFGEKWLASQSGDPNTRASIRSQLKLHAFPRIGSRPLGAFQPSHIREFVTQLEASNMSGSYARVIFSNVRAILSAAVEDGYLSRNPCHSRTVSLPEMGARRVVPWLPERVFAVREALNERFRPMVDAGAGCGLRQGEILGLSVEELDFDNETLHVVQQLKLSLSQPVFAPPKGGKLRDVPLPAPVADALKRHMKRFPPVEITLPWMRAGGSPVTKRLIFTGPLGGHVWRTSLNEDHWKPALAAVGVIPTAKSREHAAAREHGMHALRHFYASVLLDAGESIKAVSEYLGHSDPGLTLKVYAHLLPSSRDRARKALGAALQPPQPPR
ncbi:MULTISPECIES: site-specific integrase [unclassified Streptomyces]|uniref:tyrosine-type recombinase/integrase n=1 Tax=unclassified Streptomyces TaxID=2593676 RepID=UPI000823BE68|nr:MULTISPECIES: site-specific integrase [unclassified Streptomyces]MYT96721.1 tyrosine-type recombinase/integrase [Streptomyces sp. SID8350]SCK58939.1 Site-specific recombinase XerD [Streptomyces sp. AmelKG-D3]